MPAPDAVAVRATEFAEIAPVVSRREALVALKAKVPLVAFAEDAPNIIVPVGL